MSILFYDDSPVFGGHEVMSLLGVEAVVRASQGPVRVIASSANEKLCSKVAELAGVHAHLTLETVDYHSSKFEAIRNRLKPARCKALAERFLEIKPALVVAIQGNIEHSSLALLAARRAGIPSTSYIPVPHSNAEMGARLGSLRDRFCAHLFQVPDSFITITDEMARLLKIRGATAPIHLVYNGVDTGRFQPADCLSARNALGLPADKVLIGAVGRIEFRQKQQHLLVRAVAADPVLVRKCHLVFAGDGPDSEALKTLIAESQLSGTVLSWSDPAILYPALDALVIPSRYEGLPLVMLEAISCGTAVLGSDRDGMKDLLPDKWRFRPNDPAALSAALGGFVASGMPAPDADLVAKVRNSMSLESFRKSFADTVLTLAGAPVSHLQKVQALPNT
ncbi:MAG: glycosyltransferase family 4 protein [Luteolibacter sp.]